MSDDRQLDRAAGARPSPPGRAPRASVIGAGLVLAYLTTWVQPAARAAGVDLPGDGPVTALWLNWLAVALLLGHVRFVERQTLASLLLTRPSRTDLEYAVLAWGVVLAWSWLIG